MLLPVQLMMKHIFPEGSTQRIGNKRKSAQDEIFLSLQRSNAGWRLSWCDLEQVHSGGTRADHFESPPAYLGIAQLIFTDWPNNVTLWKINFQLFKESSPIKQPKTKTPSLGRKLWWNGRQICSRSASLPNVPHRRIESISPISYYGKMLNDIYCIIQS